MNEPALQETKPVPAVHLQCVRCRSPLPDPPQATRSHRCERCQLEYELRPNAVKYDGDRLLFEDFRNDFLLYKVLANNSYIAYQVLADSSLSVKGRDDVDAFCKYIRGQLSGGNILDIGCGTLPLPGYLDFPDKERFHFFGLDPIEESAFEGIRVIGCSEFLPFPDGSFEAVIFATSLDHVCSLERTAGEAVRVLQQGGKAIIWMGDRSRPLRERVVDWAKTRARNLVRRYRTDRYVVYDNLAVFYVPKGAIDPFHSFPEDPRNIVRLMEKAGLRLADQQYHNRNQVFLCFEK